MEVSVQENVVLTEKIRIARINIHVSRRIPRGDHHELLLLNGCIPCLERLPTSFRESTLRPAEGRKVIRDLQSLPLMDLFSSSIGIECRSSYMARQGTMLNHLRRFLRMVVRGRDWGIATLVLLDGNPYWTNISEPHYKFNIMTYNIIVSFV